LSPPSSPLLPPPPWATGNWERRQLSWTTQIVLKALCKVDK
jgi:hypothetical protein